jgi:hypothetical protein
MTDTTEPSVCPNCTHPHHLPGTECATPVHHGPSHWHLCLCLARPGAASSCPPQMACQGGTLGYSDIWYLQQGHSLSSADGVISPEVLTVGPVSVGYPPASAVVPAADRAALRDRIADALYAHDHPGWRVPLAESDVEPVYRERASAALSVLPAPADRAAEAPATECSAQHRRFDDGRLCIRAAQHHGDHIDERGFHWSDTVAVYPVDDGTFRQGVNLGALRLAAESAAVDRVTAETPSATLAAQSYERLASRVTEQPSPAVEAQPGNDTETPQPTEA